MRGYNNHNAKPTPIGWVPSNQKLIKKHKNPDELTVGSLELKTDKITQKSG